MSSIRARGGLWALFACIALCGCAHASGAQKGVGPGPEGDGITRTPGTESGPATLPLADRALHGGDAARALALYAEVLEREPDLRVSAYAGIARAHEQLGNFQAALRAHQLHVEALVAAQAPPATLARAWLRRGACEAELEDWAASAESLAQIVGGPKLPGSLRIETLARRGYALFQLDRFDEAAQVLREGDVLFREISETGSERLETYYFVGMTRFYLGAIEHRRFRAAEIRLPEAQMTEDFVRKLELLQQAQAHYRETIRAKHMYWVTAAGYQMGSLFEEFYDALMYAPLPKWLGPHDKAVYYRELKKQLRPIVEKALWVFEKNMETARRLGYRSAFIEDTERQLSALQRLLLSDDDTLGQPHPRTAPRDAWPEFARAGLHENESDPSEELAQRAFLPRRTPL